MASIGRICDLGAVLNSGALSFYGNTQEAISLYEAVSTQDADTEHGIHFAADAVDNFSFQVSPKYIETGETVDCRLEIILSQPIELAAMRIVFYDYTRTQVAEWGSQANRHIIKLPIGKSIINTKFTVQLRAGKYYVSLCLTPPTGIDMLAWSHMKHEIEISGSDYGYSSYQMQTLQKHNSFKITSV